MRIVGFHASPVVGILRTDIANPRKSSPLLQFILFCEHDRIKVAYHLDAFVASVCKLLRMTPDQCTVLHDREYIEVQEGSQSYKLKYAPGKFFSVGQLSNDRFCTVFDISQYLTDGGKILPDNSLGYAQKLARIAKETCQQVYDALCSIGLHPTSLASPITSYRKEVLSKMDLCNVDDMPEEAGEWAYDTCAAGGWVEAFKRGHFENAFDFDVACYSEDTECLSFDGWKRISELSMGEHILTFNSQINKCEFQPVTHLHHSPYDGKMLSINLTKVDLLVTPNHTILFRNHIRNNGTSAYRELGRSGYTGWITNKAELLPKGNIRLPVSYPFIDRGDYPISDSMLRIIAWVITEGHSTKNLRTGAINGVCISQGEGSSKNIGHCKEIRDCLTSESITFSDNSRNRNYISKQEASCDEIFHGTDRMLWSTLVNKYQIASTSLMVNRLSTRVDHNFRIFLESLDKIPLDKRNIHEIPLWILQQCSLRQLSIFFDTLIKGDGSRHYGDEGLPHKTGFYTKLKVNADRMMYLCHLLGNKVSMKRPDIHHSTYQIFINEHMNGEKSRSNPHDIDVQHGAYGSERIKWVPYSGMVYCPTVDNGYVIVRRNNKSCICGNSAYPSQAMKVPDLRIGKWVQSKEIPENAYLGYASCTVNITSHFSPVFFTVIRGESQYDRHNYTPTGRFPKKLTKGMIEFVRKWKLGTVEIHDGHWWIPERLEYPLASCVAELYKHRESATGLRKDVIKRICVGLYGTTLQTIKGRFTEFFNPAWGAEIESNTRIYLAEWCILHNIIPLHCVVDGILIDRKIETPSEKRLGEMHLSGQGNALILSSGMTALQGKFNGKDFSMNYEDLVSRIKDNPSAREYTLTKIAPVTIGKCLNEPDLWPKLGSFTQISRTIDVTYEDKRYYPNAPKCGDDLLNNQYDSKPWDASILRVRNNLS